MRKIELTFQSLINKWPSTAEFARQMNTDYQQVWGWYRRDSVPPRYWSDLLAIAKDKGIKITADDLILMSQSRKSRMPEPRYVLTH